MGKKIEKSNHVRKDLASKLKKQVKIQELNALKQQRQSKHEKVKYEQQLIENQQNKSQEPKVQNKIQENVSNDKKGLKKHNRIIIRNLIIDINEKHLTKLLSPFGQIIQISIPKNPDKNISKGFAFVQFKKKNQCHKAIKQLNGKVYKGRTIILDHSVSKQSYQAQKLDIPDQKNEVKDQQSLKQQKMANDDNEIENQDNSEGKEDNQEQKEVQKVEEQKQQEDLSSTIFIRNMPVTIDEKKLYDLFRKYGKIKYAKVCINRDTGLSKGTGFIKFLDKDVAQSLIHYSRSYQMYILKKLHHFVADPNINLEIDGKIIKIFSGESRKNLEQKVNSRNQDQLPKQQKVPVKKIRNIQDFIVHDPNNKRNLKLALEGMWRATDDMKENDYQKFKSHEREKIQKLKNPNHFISPTRVILKFLDKKITEEDIRQVAYEFLQGLKLKRRQLKYCKLMLDRNMQKSAGYAFLQFTSHQLSLNFINYIKQSPKVLMNFPYVCEFTIQDSRKLIKKTKQITKQSHKQVSQDKTKQDIKIKNSFSKSNSSQNKKKLKRS